VVGYAAPTLRASATDPTPAPLNEERELTTPIRETPLTAPPSPPSAPSGGAAPRSRGRLLAVLGVGFGLAVTIGNTIGMGILRTPGDVAASLPDPWLYIGVWIVGGIYALLGANSIAELGTAIPRSGGMYVFVRRALGPYAGFVVGWNDWISTAGSAAAVALVIGEYAPALLPALEGRTAAIALAAIAAFTIVQWRGVREAARTQEVTSALKGLLLLVLVVVFFAVEPATPVRAEPAQVPAGFALFAAAILALQAVIYTYDGWTGVVYFGGEVKDPARDVPRSMLGGVLLITAIYLLLNLGYMNVIPVPAMAGEQFVAGRAAEAIFGETGARAVRGLIVLGMLSAVNALVMMASRVLHAMSGDGLFAQRGAAVNLGGTPTVALFLSALVAAAFILTGTVTQVVAVCAFFFVANYVLAFVSVIVLRRREPELPRPFRAWGYPWTTMLVLAGSVAFLAGSVVGDTRQSLISLALVAVSWPVYRAVKALVR
jgi:basic amino acid/polyamine antiporter, APA family